jgi:hypothetical protein
VPARSGPSRELEDEEVRAARHAIYTTDPACSPRRISSSLPSRHRSTTRGFPTSGRWSAPASASAGT